MAVSSADAAMQAILFDLKEQVKALTAQLAAKDELLMTLLQNRQPPVAPMPQPPSAPTPQPPAAASPGSAQANANKPVKSTGRPARSRSLPACNPSPTPPAARQTQGQGRTGASTQLPSKQGAHATEKGWQAVTTKLRKDNESATLADADWSIPVRCAAEARKEGGICLLTQKSQLQEFLNTQFSPEIEVWIVSEWPVQDKGKSLHVPAPLLIGGKRQLQLRWLHRINGQLESPLRQTDKVQPAKVASRASRLVLSIVKGFRDQAAWTSDCSDPRGSARTWFRQNISPNALLWCGPPTRRIVGNEDVVTLVCCILDSAIDDCHRKSGTSGVFTRCFANPGDQRRNDKVIWFQPGTTLQQAKSKIKSLPEQQTYGIAFGTKGLGIRPVDAFAEELATQLLPSEVASVFGQHRFEIKRVPPSIVDEDLLQALKSSLEWEVTVVGRRDRYRDKTVIVAAKAEPTADRLVLADGTFMPIERPTRSGTTASRKVLHFRGKPDFNNLMENARATAPNNGRESTMDGGSKLSGSRAGSSNDISGAMEVDAGTNILPSRQPKHQGRAFRDKYGDTSEEGEPRKTSAEQSTCSESDVTMAQHLQAIIEGLKELKAEVGDVRSLVNAQGSRIQETEEQLLALEPRSKRTKGSRVA